MAQHSYQDIFADADREKLDNSGLNKYFVLANLTIEQVVKRGWAKCMQSRTELPWLSLGRSRLASVKTSCPVSRRRSYPHCHRHRKWGKCLRFLTCRGNRLNYRRKRKKFLKRRPSSSRVRRRTSLSRRGSEESKHWRRCGNTCWTWIP